MKLNEFEDVRYLQRVVTHLYDLLDAIDTADDIAKSDDAAYRRLVSRFQQRKNDSGVFSDGYSLLIEEKEFQTNEEKGTLL